MKFLLDSDVVSEFYETQSGGHLRLAEKLAKMANSDVVCISILTIFEFEFGCANAQEDKQETLRKRIKAAQNDFQVLPLSAEQAQIYGDLKKALISARGLDQKRGKLHNIDIMIAATAISEGSVLVSSDLIYRELQRFNNSLRLENWLSK